uniref:C-type lectin domain-containing protein n=2 Tax=Magallana gigas TaxID=29159 RepID=A0A8W8JHT7_MAGGI|nr:galactose-specific lectin nattectin [Crassostrea gigas]
MPYLTGFLFFLGIVYAVNSQGCRDGWLHHGNSCYAFIDAEPDGWIEAMFYCSSVGAKLVEIETESENNFLKRHLQTTGATKNYWIGLSDAIKEGKFVWQTTQDNVDYTDWAPGEPNDDHHTEDCAELFQPFSFHWNDAPCSVKSNFICEKTLVESVDIIG